MDTFRNLKVKARGKDTERREMREWGKEQGNVENGKEEMSHNFMKQKDATPNYPGSTNHASMFKVRIKKIKTISRNSKKAHTS